jgi:flagellar biosynthesis/type III secretory pathway chaperone
MSASNAVEALLPKPSPTMVVDTFKLVVTSANEWVTVVAQEQTRRQEIRAWEKSQLEIIHVQRDFLLTALDKTFDERRENFRRLFDQLDAALVSDRDDAAAQVSDLLGTITDLAKTSPFKDLKSPTLVVQEFLNSGRVIEL